MFSIILIGLIWLIVHDVSKQFGDFFPDSRLIGNRLVVLRLFLICLRVQFVDEYPLAFTVQMHAALLYVLKVFGSVQHTLVDQRKNRAVNNQRLKQFGNVQIQCLTAVVG